MRLPESADIGKALQAYISANYTPEETKVGHRDRERRALPIALERPFSPLVCPDFVLWLGCCQRHF
jgi:hypothetical protein